MDRLPPELWCRILQFLPNTVVQDLYSLNSVCFDLAMDARYRNVVFDRMDKQLSRNLDILQNPDIARRVKSLRIAPHLFYSEGQRGRDDGTQNTAHSGLFSRMMHRVKHPRQIHVDESFANLSDASIRITPEALLEILQHFINIHTFYLDGTLSDDDSFSTFNLWSIVGQNLQDLTILVTSITPKTMLPPPVVKFPHLQRLQIIIKARPNDVEIDISASLLATASFVNSLKDTLQHLSIQYSICGGLSLLYEHLGTFPCLYSLDIDLSQPRFQNVVEGATMHSTAFVERHKHIIRTLSLSGIKDLDHHYIVYSIPTRLPLKRLRHLSINAVLIEGMSAWDRMQRFLKAHQNILESLEIVGLISSAEIKLLLGVFNHRDSAECALIKLSISTYRLDLTLLLNLAEGLEQLNVLQLEILKVAPVRAFGFIPEQFFPMHLPPDKDVHEFVSEIAACEELRGWNLRDITIQRRSCCGDLVLWRLMQLLAICIPTISSFAGSGDMEIPNPQNVRPNFGRTRCSGGFECTYGKDGVDDTPP